jgi:hypothetical protein
VGYRHSRKDHAVPQRLAELLDAIVGEQNPVVRGRAAALLLRDLAAASAKAELVLDEAVRQLQEYGAPTEEIAALLGLPQRP